MTAKLKDFFATTNEERVKIRELFNKKESDVIEDLKILKEWLKKQPQIPKIENDNLLEGLLIRNKFRVEKTKLKIDKYFTSKWVYPEIYNNIDPCADNFLEVVNHTIIIPMPKLSPNYERVIYWSMGNGCNNDLFCHKDCLLLALMYLEAEMNYDYSASEIVIFDMKNFHGSIMTRLDFATLGKLITVQAEAFSGRQSSVHLINCNSMLDFLLTMMKPLMPSKLFSKITVHHNLDTLYECVPKECLPTEIGGTGPSAVKLFNSFMSACRREQSEILKRNATKTNEKLRIGEPPLKSNMFGVDGTFKKINID